MSDCARIVPRRCFKQDMHIELIPNTGYWVQYEAAGEVNRPPIDFFR